MRQFYFVILESTLVFIYLPGFPNEKKKNKPENPFKLDMIWSQNNRLKLIQIIATLFTMESLKK